ncbi:hypothetical protein LCGC14_0501320 [marine sediment metagenome]|uniref:Elp3/MiaA/NifB-like radical SAM core domain-containing protein n=1 Tax=marine sediment metagenome TaxID=412755 RepID=A0A0F9UQM9_9ZZZZ
MESIFCISAGQLIVKKQNHKINKQNKYLNYGLLSLATILKTKGWSPVQLHGHFDHPTVIIAECLKLGLSKLSIYPILISIPSFYAISWVNEFIDLVKNINSKIKVIIGGRWVIADRPDLMSNLVPRADKIVSGVAESKIEELIYSMTQTISKTDSREKVLSTSHSKLDYSLLLKREIYQPRLEVSRGCGMGCSFCQERDEKLLPLKPASLVINEVKDILLEDDLNKMNFYFESSMFIPNIKWIEQLHRSIQESGILFSWRTESRVDTIQAKHIPDLAKAGLKVIDLGLESASPVQLITMKKTSNPKSYLEKASRLIKTCYEHGVVVKVNLLLTAGETMSTITQTLDWLDNHKTYIRGLSVGPVIVFGWDADNENYLNELCAAGASFSHSPTTGIKHLNLSKEISYEKSISLSNEISRDFMRAEDYFYLKSFSYFSRYYSFEDFIQDVKAEKRDYSFSVI